MDRPTDLVARLEAAGQAHVLAHWDRLEEAERQALVADLEALDLESLAECIDLLDAPAPEAPTKLEPLPQVREGADAEADAEASGAGIEMLRAGKVAAFTVAGGQGTRLGHDGPKGTFPVTPITGRPLFRLFAERLRALGTRVGQPVPWYIMTSPGNHEETVRFFEDHDHFGLDPEDLQFFSQGTCPAVTAEGRLILETPTAVFRSPDGHGGSLRALHSSGALADMRDRGVEEIFYFQVDNPLVRICDPVFLGYHRQSGSDFSSKAVPKRGPHEKVGVLVAADGEPAVIEYSDLPEDLAEATGQDGELVFRAGNIAVHVMRRAFVEELNRDGFSLPWHVARKKIPGLDADLKPTSFEGAKFETFVFDALPLASRTLLMEVPRALEFSPVKNKEGADSPATAAADQIALHASWLEKAGIEVPRDGEGRSVHRIEISPLFAQDAADVRRRRDEIPPLDRDLLLED